MATYYVPSEKELVMVGLSHILSRKRNDLTTQDGLIASLVHDICNYNYNHTYSLDPRTTEIAMVKHRSITERIALIEDEQLRHSFKKCFSATEYENVLKLVPWGEHFHKVTKYVYLRWDGHTDQEARRLAMIYIWIRKIHELVKTANVYNHVIYSNDVQAAVRILRNGIRWSNGKKLSPIAVPGNVYAEVAAFARQYMKGKIRYSDFKALFPSRVESLVIANADGWTVEFVRIRNFSFVIVG